MTILGIETATAVCAAALVRDGVLVGERSIEAPQAHSEKLVLLIDEVLREGAVDAPMLDAIAVSIGPGSYTGLRIGLSVAKGLSYALAKPLVAVSTLEAAAWHVMSAREIPDGASILALIESRREELFAALYHIEGRAPVVVHEPSPLGIGDVLSLLSGTKDVYAAGSGADILEQRAAHDPAIAGAVQFPPRGLRQCSASAVAVIGSMLFARGEVADPATIEPRYLKEFYTTARPQQYPV